MRIEHQKTDANGQLWQGIENIGVDDAQFGSALISSAKKTTAKDQLSKSDPVKSVNLKDATYLKPEAEDKKTMEDEIEEGSVLSARDRKNQMAVLSNTTSEEDYEKMQEDGFSLDSTTGKTIVTEVDKIKAQLAKAGVDISTLGDDLSEEQLEEITGSTYLAAGLESQIKSAMQEADLPLTEDNINGAVDAVKMAGSVDELDTGAIKYLIENELEPTIENIYLAKHSGDARYMPEGEELDLKGMTEQLSAVIEKSGYEVNEETLSDAKWLVENEIALTPQNLSYYEKLSDLTFPIDTDTLLTSITAAIKETGNARNALLADNIMSADEEMAEHAVEVINSATDDDIDYLISNEMTVNVQNLEYAASQRSQTSGRSIEETLDSIEKMQTSDAAPLQVVYRRQLEEARLMMTVEANNALIKRGISIDTTPLEQLVEELKDEEQKYYDNLLASQGVKPSDENVNLFKDTLDKIEDIKSVPAYVLGMPKVDVSTIEGVHEAGMALKDKFELANERYETLMTAPRADLGDSMQKAFGNVDDILKDLDMDTSEANRRAVRILAYNETQIDPDTIAKMKLADEQVQRVFKQMTPAVVTEMIKEEINPLDLNISALDEVSAQLEKDLGDSDARDNAARKFGEFLWKMEQNNEISADEREAYIGIYRLINQVEGTDGAAIGALVNQGAPITMRNLMMAVRTEHKSGKMDYVVDEDFGSVEGNTNNSIIDQIESAYQAGCVKDAADMLTPERLRELLNSGDDWQDMTPEQLKEALAQTETDESETDRAYAATQLELLSECADVSEDIYGILEKYDIPETVSNIIALDMMTKNRNQVFKKLFENRTESETDETLENFMSALSSPDELAAAEEKLHDMAEDAMQESFMQDGVTSIDINEMRRMSAQINIASYMAREENYQIPVKVSDGIVNVSLKVVRGADKKGMVDITMESDDHGKIAASFTVGENNVTGLIATDEQETEKLLLDNKSEIAADDDVKIALIDNLDLNHFSGGLAEADSDSETTDGVQTSKLYGVAEKFIIQMRDLLGTN
jgi:hypothetical protein